MIGVDITRISRFRRLYKKFNHVLVSKIMNPEEIKDKTITPQFLAGRWAAKEAIAKALGTGFHSQLKPSDIVILNHTSGKPYVRIQSDLPQNNFNMDVAISISHDGDYAVAVAFLIKN